MARRIDTRTHRTIDLVTNKGNKRSALDHRVEIFGLDDFLKQLRYAPKETRKAVAQGSKAIADHVAGDMKRAARVVWHAESYELIAPTIRAVQGRTPKVKVGKATLAKVNTRYPSGKRRKVRPKTGQLVMGLEFGGRRSEETMQFPFHRGKRGYVLFPTIRKSHGFIKKEYTKMIGKALGRLA